MKDLQKLKYVHGWLLILIYATEAHVRMEDL